MDVRSFAGALALVTIATAGAARAEPAFTYATDKDREEIAKVKAIEWKASAQGGLVITAGNSRTTAVSGGMNASRKSGANKLQLEAGVAYSRSSVFLALDANGSGAIDPGEIQRPATTTSKGYTSKARYDRFLTSRDSLYAAVLAAADEPAGKEFYGGGQVGYSRVVFKNAMHTLLAEGGYDFSYEDPVVGAGAGIHSGRAFAGYAGKLSEDTGLDASVDALLNVNAYDAAGREIDAFEDTRVTSKLSLTTKMFDDLSFRFAFESRYDHAPSPRPPFPGIPYAAGFVPLADELDTKVEATLILSFL